MYSAQINSSESSVFICRGEFNVIISSIFNTTPVCVYGRVFMALPVQGDNGGLPSPTATGA